jgi:glycine/D-amino acid oxidase-like deaminating enzyme
VIARKISNLPSHLSVSGWEAVLPARQPEAELDKAITADWLIIGAGFAGLSAARRLTQHRPNDHIVVIDATHVAGGSSGRNSGFMIDLPHDLSTEGYAHDENHSDARWTRMSRAAIRFSADAAEEYAFTAEVFDPCGKINAASTQKGDDYNLGFANYLKARGEPHELLEARAMKEICGTSFYHQGLWSPGGAVLQPAAFVRGLAAGLRGKIDLYENTPALRLARQGQDWLVGTPKGRISAPRVILAVNGHVESFGFFKRRLMHVFAYASMTRPLSDDEIKRLGGSRRWGVVPADPMGSTVRRISGEGGDRIVVRSRYTYDPTMDLSKGRMRGASHKHDRVFAERFPMLRNVSMQYRWAGRLCLSRNRSPAFGEVEEGVFSACCDNGLGLSKGTFAGMAAAEMAAGENSPLLAEMLSFQLPSRLPPEPLSYIGANAVLRWGEWRAGAA